MIIKNYYTSVPINIDIQLLLDVIQENNWVITTKNGECELPLFCGN